MYSNPTLTRIAPIRWKRVTLMLILGWIGMMIQPVLAQETDQLPTDQQITNAIADEFLLDPGVSRHRLTITTEEGIATLAGTVNNLLAQDRAIKIAETVKGVRSVIDQIEIEDAGRSDKEITNDIKAALLANPRTEAYEIEVDVDQGTVRLTGSVESWQEKDLAATVAKSVKGVRGIDNQIQVSYAMERPDDEIKEDIVSALRWDRLVDDALIDVQVDNGEVTLSGTVGSAAERRRARNNAWVAGVQTVDTNALEVAYWARDEALRTDKYTVKSDLEIRAAVEDALTQDPRVSPFNVAVAVTDGIVTLRGTVDNLAAKRAAGKDARNTVGVWRVKNRIQVQPTTVAADTAIADDVRAAILRDPYVESFEITVRVNNGEVTLNGIVDSDFEKARAEDVVADLASVVDVNNNLDVVEDYALIYDPYVDESYPYDYAWYDYQTVTATSDWEIRDDIKDELWWSPFVDSDEVTVAVDNGVATLTGTVDSWSERQSATENALEGGAVRVVNRLDVEAGPGFDLF